MDQAEQRSHEVNRFAQLKSPVLLETVGNIRDLSDSTAGRGHHAIPGHYWHTLMQIEHIHKLKLSEINMQVVKEVMDLLTGAFELDKNMDAERARIQFDLWQAELFSDLEREIGQDKSNAELGLLHIRDLSVENNLRRIIIEEALKNIRVELESAQREILPYRELVVNEADRLGTAKYATLEKRLQIIPLLERNMSRRAILVAKELDLVALLENLLPYRITMAELDRQISLKDWEIANARLYIARQYVALYAEQRTTIELREIVLTKRSELLELQKQLRTVRSETLDRRAIVLEKEAEVIEAQIAVREARGEALDQAGIVLDTQTELIGIQRQLLDKELEVLAENAKYIAARRVLIQKQDELLEAQEGYLDVLDQRLVAESGLLDEEGHLVVAEAARMLSQEQLLTLEVGNLNAERNVLTEMQARIGVEYRFLAARRDHLELLETLVAAREEYLESREAIAEKTAERAEKSGDLAQKEETDLLPAIQDRLDKLTDHVSKQIEMLPFDTQLIEYQVRRGLLTRDRVESENRIANARLDMMRSQNQLALLKIAISLAEREGQVAYETTRMNEAMQTLTKAEAVLPLVHQNTEDTRDIDLETTLYERSRRAMLNEKTAAEYHKAAARAVRRKSDERIRIKKAEHDAQVKSKITNNLTHLLGSTS